ncbi:putative phage abortive infection protein [Leeuwenhoekiella nanhaiensis]|uniref:Phage abortive infection protein n=1 Tax=Leeuwenhoekiella nanhaiensis TaxID=1655491 RepID=A0A2G1VPU9_9FLAO|nr:putative phage abortive infection protein [Leeuwenhoekiella nanhaiensis]PHQ28791.1 hypothetical protein CJ305_13315 [Leeuwenhoekiella nanhaiensis]
MNSERIEKDLKKLETSIKWFKRSAFLLILLGFACLYVVHWQNENVYPMQWNEVGDFLGGTMVGIWSLAGLFFIYVAFLGQKQQMIYQQQELKLNRDDLELNREEIRNTNAALELQRYEMANQNETAKRQQFESLFFNMIDTHLKIVADIDITVSGEGKITGRDVFARCLTKELGRANEGNSKIEAYRTAYAKYSTEFGHYYRFLYRIISRIDEQVFVSKSTLDPDGDIEKEYFLRNYEVRYEYTSIVRSLLSDEELEMLFYNMIFFHDLRFKPLIEKYCLLKNIPKPDKKISNPDYVFDIGAIRKNENSNLLKLSEFLE